MKRKLHTSVFKIRERSRGLLKSTGLQKLGILRNKRLRFLATILPLVVVILSAIPGTCLAPLKLRTAIEATPPGTSQVIHLEREVHRIFERFHMPIDGSLIHEMTLVGVADRVDPRLIAAVVVAESSGDPLAISHQNSIGLMQINAKVWARKLDFTHNNPFDPSTNLRMGVPILRACMDEYHGLDSALAAYVGDADSSREETVSYVNRVIRIFEKAASIKVPRTLTGHVSARREPLPSEGLQDVAYNRPTP